MKPFCEKVIAMIVKRFKNFSTIEFTEIWQLPTRFQTNHISALELALCFTKNKRDKHGKELIANYCTKAWKYALTIPLKLSAK